MAASSSSRSTASTRWSSAPRTPSAGPPQSPWPKPVRTWRSRRRRVRSARRSSQTPAPTKSGPSTARGSRRRSTRRDEARRRNLDRAGVAELGAHRHPRERAGPALREAARGDHRSPSGSASSNVNLRRRLPGLPRGRAKQMLNAGAAAASSTSPRSSASVAWPTAAPTAPPRRASSTSLAPSPSSGRAPASRSTPSAPAGPRAGHHRGRGRSAQLERYLPYKRLAQARRDRGRRRVPRLGRGRLPHGPGGLDRGRRPEPRVGPVCYQPDRTDMLTTDVDHRRHRRPPPLISGASRPISTTRSTASQSTRCWRSREGPRAPAHLHRAGRGRGAPRRCLAAEAPRGREQPREHGPSLKIRGLMGLLARIFGVAPSCRSSAAWKRAPTALTWRRTRRPGNRPGRA